MLAIATSVEAKSLIVYATEPVYTVSIKVSGKISEFTYNPNWIVLNQPEWNNIKANEATFTFGIPRGARGLIEAGNITGNYSITSLMMLNADSVNISK